MSNKIAELKLLQKLSPETRTAVLRDYEKGWHFLIVLGKIAYFSIIGISLALSREFLAGLEWPFRILILILVVFVSMVLIELIVGKYITPKIIKDLIKHNSNVEERTG